MHLRLYRIHNLGYLNGVALQPEPVLGPKPLVMDTAA